MSWLDDEGAEAPAAEEGGLAINEAYAQRFKYNKQREELERLQLKHVCWRSGSLSVSRLSSLPEPTHCHVLPPLAAVAMAWPGVAWLWLTCG